MMKEDRIAKLCFLLMGTTSTIEGACEELGFDESSLTEGEFHEIDQNVFLCADCGWWCEISEEVSDFAGLEEWTCSDCAKEGHGWNGEE